MPRGKRLLFSHAAASSKPVITIEETIVVDEAGHATFTLPPSIKPGLHRAVLQIDDAEEKAAPGDHSKLIGLWKGKIGFQPGWDEPVDDFREYLE